MFRSMQCILGISTVGACLLGLDSIYTGLSWAFFRDNALKIKRFLPAVLPFF